MTQEQLWKFFPGLVAHFRGLGLKPEDAQDVVQDAMVAAVQKLDTFRGEAALSTWLFAIAERQCLLFWRRARAQKRSGIEIPAVDSREEGEPGVVLADRSADPEEQSLDRERYDAVRGEIAKLPGRMREALVLFVYCGHPYKEIASRLQRPVNEISSLIHQARQKLRRADSGPRSG